MAEPPVLLGPSRVNCALYRTNVRAKVLWVDRAYDGAAHTRVGKNHFEALFYRVAGGVASVLWARCGVTAGKGLFYQHALTVLVAVIRYSDFTIVLEIPGDHYHVAEFGGE